MTLTTAVTDGYRHATNRLIETNWTHAAGVYFATQLAASVWMFYLLVAFESSSGTVTVMELTPGLHDGVTTGLIASALIGAMVAPFLYATCWLVSRRWQSARASVAGVWLLGGPGLFLALVGKRIQEIGADGVLSDMQAAPGEVAYMLAVFAGSATVLALLVGGVYALTTGQVRPSRRQRRALVVVAAVLVAVPIGVGAAVPMDDGSEYDPDIDGTGDVPEDPAGENDTDDTDDTDDTYERPNATDPAVYDNGDLSPYIESVDPLESEADAVATLEDPRPPTANESTFSYPISETHTDADVTVSKVNATVRGGAVVPDARYHLEFDGVNTTIERVISYRAYETTRVEGFNKSLAKPTVYHGSTVETETGLFVNMERAESTFVYTDVVTDDGEIHRYVVGLERTE